MHHAANSPRADKAVQNSRETARPHCVDEPLILSKLPSCHYALPAQIVLIPVSPEAQPTCTSRKGLSGDVLTCTLDTIWSILLSPDLASSPLLTPTSLLASRPQGTASGEAARSMLSAADPTPVFLMFTCY